MFGLTRKKLELPSADEALPGRDTPIPTSKNHYVNGNPLKGPYPAGHEIAYLAFGCYWGCERVFWTLPGVWVTAVGNIGGTTPNPTYQEVCSGRTGHAEAVKVVFDPSVISYEQILKHFWEAHDPTQGMRQGNDVGTQYRSGIYWVGDAQRDAAIASKQAYQKALDTRGYGSITAEVREAGEFYYAEKEHQQYLGKNPMGYCGLAGTGVTCPVGMGVEA